IILERGYNYYVCGNILDIHETKGNKYTIEVEGTENYEVLVELDKNGKIVYSTCNCPYDFSPICKHQVAAYYQIYDILNNKHKDEKNVVKLNLKELLNKLSKEELINIILDLSKKDTALKDNIIFRYSDCNDIKKIEKYELYLDTIIKRHKGREGFISYMQTYKFANDMREVLENIEQTYNSNKNILLFLNSIFILVEKSIKSFKYTDDSSGYISEIVSESIELINTTIHSSNNFDMSTRELILEKILEESNNKIFYDLEEYKIELLKMCLEFIDIEVFRNKIKKELRRLIELNKYDTFRGYYNEELNLILFEIISKYGTEEEIEKFIKKNISFTSYRKILINKLLEEKNYGRVIEFALQGEKQDKNYRGLVIEWKEIRYIAYKESLLKDKQELLAKDLLLHGKFKYYKELKNLHKDNWEAFYKNLKEELKNSQEWYTIDVYIKIITEEKDLEAIIKLVREKHEYIETYASILMDKYKDEVIDIYEKHVKFNVRVSSNRSQYRNVCRMIIRYGKVVGKKKAEKTINDLKILYNRRTAFLDEMYKCGL
ncbi:SWIM zinc finger family protein, partial [Clostridium botulinum]|uniref:SWIM zinc finger family protein n=1 Tax=Clostridium botulinum TaxID=1491 RepID=UPI001E37A890